MPPYLQGGCTPLWKASWKGHTEIVERLLAAKADVDAKSEVRDVGE